MARTAFWQTVISPAKPYRRRRIGKPLIIFSAVFGALLVGLVIFWFQLPRIFQERANAAFSQVKGYNIHIGTVSLHPLKGAFGIDDIRILKTSGEVEVPFFFCERLDISILWRGLLHGNVVGKVDIVSPDLNFVDGNTPQEKQTGEGQPWVAAAKEFIPIDVDRLRILHGVAHFRNFSSKPPVDLSMDQIEVVLRNLTNNEKFSGSLLATAEISARLLEHAPVKVDLKIDPFAETPTFEMAALLTGLQVKTFNDLAKAYARVDFEEGTFDLAAEAKAKNGYLEAYAKPIFHNLKVVSYEGDVKRDKDNPLRVAWESMVGAVGGALKNQPKDQLATRIPLSGKIENPDAGILATLGGILKNAFVRALFPQLEHSIVSPDQPRD